MKAYIIIIVALLSFKKTIYGIDLKQFNRYVNLAELAIVDNNSKQADKYYYAAFKVNDKPLATDLQNALCNAVNLKNKVRAFYYANKLAGLGIGPGYFEKKANFTWLRAHTEWQDLVRRATAERKKIQSEQAGLLQILRQMKGEYDEIISQLSVNNISSDSIRSLTREKEAIEFKLVRLFSEKGYLSEYVIGLNVIGDTIMEPPIFTSILKMKYLRPADRQMIKFQNDTLAQILTEAMYFGAVSADFIAQTINTNFSDEIKLPPVYIVGCDIYEFKNSSSFYKKLNVRRASIGLSTYNQYLKKLSYQAKHISPLYRLVPNMPTYSFTSQWLVENLKKLKVVASFDECDSK